MHAFYKCNEDSRNLIKVLYFSTETIYNKETFLNISKYIPLKYFVPEIQKNTDGSESVKIIYAFPLVEEVVNNLILEIIYGQFNIYDLLVENKSIDGGARGYLFEKYVTYLLLSKKGNKRKKFFDDVDIDEEININEFIPIKKPKKKIPENRNHLGDGTYLFTQNKINGKDFDIMLAIIKNNNAEIIAIQISIHKPNDKIFDIKYLKKSLNKLKNNLNNLYDFTISDDNFGFTYIFDESYGKKYEKKMEDMLDKCEENNIKYLLFDITNYQFNDRNKKKIEKFFAQVIYPFNKSLGRKNQELFFVDKSENLLNDFLSKKLKRNNTYLSERNKNIIINILKSDHKLGSSITDLIHEKDEYDLKYQNFDRNKIYIAKYEKSEWIALIYFSKSKQDFLVKTIGEDISTQDSYIIDIYEIYKIEQN